MPSRRTARPTLHVALVVSALSLASPAFAQSLVAANLDTAKNQPNVPVVLSYLPGADSGSFDFELRYPQFVTALPTVTHNIPNGALSCRLPAPGRLRCVVVSSSAGLDLGAGTLTVPFATAGSNGTAPLSFQFAHFFAQSGAREAGSTTPGSLNVGAQPALSIENLAVAEGASGTSVASFTVTLSPVAPSPVSFDIGTETGTAMPGVDYVAQALSGQVIPAGQGSYSFNVLINGDAVVEANETFPVRLTNVGGAAVSDGEALATIVNDDLAGLSVSDAVVTEGNLGLTTARFSVTLSHPVPTPVTFSIATSNGTAQAGTDFVANSQVGRIIDAGRSSAVFEVAVQGDAVDEPDETFTVTLGAVSGASLVDGTGIATIVDDDGAAIVSIAQIQGTGAASPLLGQTLSTAGVVTAITADGFFLQSADGGHGIGAASMGIAVLSAQRDVAVGDLRRVHGTVQEVRMGPSGDPLTLTRIAASQAQLLERNKHLPEPVRLDAGNAGAEQALRSLERYEGMRVSIPLLDVVGPSTGALDQTSGEVRDSGRFYGVAHGVARPFLQPGANILSSPPLGFGLSPWFDGNPERLRIDSVAQRGATLISVDAGDTVTGLLGVLGYADGAYQLLPDPEAPIVIASNANPRAVAASGPGQASVAVLNLDRRVANARKGALPALSPEAYAVRLAKTANLLCAFARAPDIVAITGFQSDAELVELAGALNANDGELLFPGSCKGDPGYTALLSPGSAAARGQGERVGYLVRSRRVDSAAPRVEVRELAEIAASRTFRHPDGTVELLHNPPPLLLEAVLQTQDGRRLDVTVVAVALSALDANAAATGEHGWRSRSEELRARRLAQATSLGRILRDRHRDRPNEKLIVLGNFEAPEFTDGHADLLDLVAAGPQMRGAHANSGAGDSRLVNLITKLPAAERYTVVRDGNAQAVEHVLVNEALLTAIPGAGLSAIRINADYGVDHANDPTVPVGLSEHDPVLLLLPFPD